MGADSGGPAPTCAFLLENQKHEDTMHMSITRFNILLALIPADIQDRSADPVSLHSVQQIRSLHGYDVVYGKTPTQNQ